MIVFSGCTTVKLLINEGTRLSAHFHRLPRHAFPEDCLLLQQVLLQALVQFLQCLLSSLGFKHLLWAGDRPIYALLLHEERRHCHLFHHWIDLHYRLCPISPPLTYWNAPSVKCQLDFTGIDDTVRIFPNELLASFLASCL